MTMDAAVPPPSRKAWAAATLELFGLGGPLASFYVIQGLVSLATMAMLRPFGDPAIGGVGAASAVYTSFCALLWGVDTGLQAMTSRITGAGGDMILARVLGAAHVVAIPLALGLAAIGWAVGPALFATLLSDPATATAAAAWFAAALPSIVLLAVSLPMNAVWMGSGRPSIALAVTLCGAPLQIALGWTLVRGFGPIPARGAAGAALAMDGAMLFAALVQVVLAARLIPGFGRTRPRVSDMRDLARVGWPISAQQSLLQVALMGVFAVVGQLGAGAAAIINVLVTLTSVPTQIETGLGVAGATLVGQALGRRDPLQARAWGWRSSFWATVVGAPLGLGLMLAPQPLLRPFLANASTLAAADWPARIAGFACLVGPAATTLGFAFRGAGATRVAAAVPFVSLWLIQLPAMAAAGLALHWGLAGIVGVQAGVTALDVLALAILWRSGFWRGVRFAATAQASPPTSPDRRIIPAH